MNRIRGRKAIGIAVAGAATAVSIAMPVTANAMSGHAPHPAVQQAPQPGPTDDPGFPTFVHMPADQAAHPDAKQEWWYTIGHIQSGGHKYGYEVMLSRRGITQISITDEKTGKYISENKMFKPEQFSASNRRLDVRMPNASLSGPIDNMHLKAELPESRGTLDLSLKAVGPTLYNNGTGLFPFLDDTSYYYSLPNVQTSGTLTLDGSAKHVTGTSWLDRQWGDWNWDTLHKWTWMAIRLDNGQTVNLWDMSDDKGEKHWATVLSPNGKQRVVSVDPLAPQARNFVTSPTTGQHYAGKWTVSIPSMNTKLTVTAKPALQEIQANMPFTPGINEADSSVSGTYQGRPVTGQAYVEQFGHWK
ncbi:lipocalin-like domain-containing protein [Streptomyces sp. BV129]|uniref:lipocalin-like domain-containing protein n=1 Tax=Streptomyces sp. BV129 TaxID=2849671 RepID=UPI0020C65F8D|nr:lipocalin-like domain-containing protein [Streptomyces sp. BV129]